jgi:hypothetical protein
MGHPAFGRLLRNERLAGILGYDPDGTPRLDVDMAVFSLAEWSRLKAHLDTLPEKRGHRTTTEGYGPALACGVCGDRLYFGPRTRRTRPTSVVASGTRRARRRRP